MSESTNSQATPDSDELPDKEYLYGRYQKHVDKRASVDVENRKWKSQLHKKMSHKALDEPMMDEDMGDIYAPKKTTINNGLSGKALLGLAVLGLPVVGLGGAGVAGFVNQWLNKEDSPPPVVQPAEDSDTVDTDTVTIPGLKFGPERE